MITSKSINDTRYEVTRVEYIWSFSTSTWYTVKPFYWVSILGSPPVCGGVWVANVFNVAVLCLPVSLDCPILIHPSGFSNGYLLDIGIHHNWCLHWCNNPWGMMSLTWQLFGGKGGGGGGGPMYHVERCFGILKDFMELSLTIHINTNVGTLYR